MVHALIVDDNYYNRDLCKLALDKVGFTSEQAEDGLQAMEMLATHHYDLLLLDLSMPELDGLGVIQQLKEMQLLDSMIIVIITAHSYLVTESSDIADFVMYKPIDIVLFTKFLNRFNKV